MDELHNLPTSPSGFVKKCYQCNNPPMWLVTDKQIPLCLSCYSIYSQIHQKELENNERMINYASDQMACIAGIPPIGPRFPPRPQPVTISGVELNNINVSNSVVGTINTGTIGTVDQTISALIQLGEPTLAEAVKKLSESIISSNDLSKSQQNELMEVISAVSAEAASPPEKRKNTVAKMLLEQGSKTIILANDIADVFQRYWPVLVDFFK